MAIFFGDINGATDTSALYTTLFYLCRYIKKPGIPIFNRTRLLLYYRVGVRAGAKGAIAPVNFEDFQKIARMHQILMTQSVNISHFLKICTRQFEILMPSLYLVPSYVPVLHNQMHPIGFQ